MSRRAGQRPRAWPAAPAASLSEAQEQIEAVRRLRLALRTATRLLQAGDEASIQAALELSEKLWPLPVRSLEQEEFAERIEGMSSMAAFNEIMQAMGRGLLTLQEARELAAGLEP